METKNKQCPHCAAPLTEKMMVGGVKNGLAFGLLKGEMGDSSRQQRMYSKIKCAECGCEYLARLMPGQHGGTVVLGMIFIPHNSADYAKPEPDKPEPEKEQEDNPPAYDLTAAVLAKKQTQPIPGTNIRRASAK